MGKLTKSKKGFTLGELVIVVGILSVVGNIAFFKFFNVIKDAEKVIASNLIRSIKIECESNNLLGKDLIFTIGCNICVLVPISEIDSRFPANGDVAFVKYR